jgi:hypothetical protein
MQELHAVGVALDVDGFMRNFLGRKKLFRTQAAGSPRPPEDVDRLGVHRDASCSVRRGEYSGWGGRGKMWRSFWRRPHRKKEPWMRGSSPRMTFLFCIQNLAVVAGLDPATHEKRD